MNIEKEVDINNIVSSHTESMFSIMTYIFKHKNNINYKDYSHETYIEKYKSIYKSIYKPSKLDYKLYNFDKYISHIHFLEVNKVLSNKHLKYLNTSSVNLKIKKNK